MTTLPDLTPRETEILRLDLSGRTNKAIATQTCIAEKRLNSILSIAIR